MMRLLRFGLMLIVAMAARSLTPEPQGETLMAEAPGPVTSDSRFTRRIVTADGGEYSVQFQIGDGANGPSPTGASLPPPPNGIHFVKVPPSGHAHDTSGFRFVSPNSNPGKLQQIQFNR